MYIAFERILYKVKILMEERLGSNVKLQCGIGQSHWAVAYLYAAEVHYVAHKPLTVYQLYLLARLAQYALLLHLCGAFCALYDGLRRESLLLYLIYAVVHTGKVFGHHNELV